MKNQEVILRAVSGQIFDFNVRHFVEKVQSEHGIKLSYTIFSHQEERVVGNDNTVSFGKRMLLVPARSFRFSVASCRALVCQHLDGTLSLYYGPHQMGCYSRGGRAYRVQPVFAAEKETGSPSPPRWTPLRASGRAGDRRKNHGNQRRKNQIQIY